MLADLEGALLKGKAEVTTFAGLEEKLSFGEATFSLVLSIIGAGAVAFPYCFALCGYIGGLALLGAFGFVAVLSYILLAQSAKAAKATSYATLVEHLPQLWGPYTKVSLWLLLILCAGSYVMIVADIVKSVALQKPTVFPWWLDNKYLFAGILILPYPLCLLKSLSSLSSVASFCSFALMTSMGLLVWDLQCLSEQEAILRTPSEAPLLFKTDVASMVLSVPIFGVSMFGHMNMPQVYAELRPELKPHVSAVVVAAIAIVVGIYVAVGVLGYAAFGSGVGPDVLVMVGKIQAGSTAVSIIQTLLASFLVLKQPLVILPLRSVTAAMFCKSSCPDAMSSTRHALLTFALIFAIYVAALAVPNLNELLEILGAVCVIPVSFIVPARLAWTLVNPRPVWQCLVVASVGVIASLLSIGKILHG